MTDGRRIPAEFLPEARRRVAVQYPDDGLAAATAEHLTAWALACMAAVERRCPPERRCRHARGEPLPALTALLGPDLGLVAGLRHGSIACASCMGDLHDLEPLLADDAEVCDVCDGRTTRVGGRTVVHVEGGNVVVDRLWEGCVEFRGTLT